MSYFKVKMHQIRFRPGLCPRPRWGSLQHSPRLFSWIQEKGEGGRQGERKSIREVRKRKESRGEGRGDEKREDEKGGNETVR